MSETDYDRRTVPFVGGTYFSCSLPGTTGSTVGVDGAGGLLGARQIPNQFTVTRR